MTQLNFRNLKITCSWNGKHFSGFQIQPNAKTIEGTLTEAWQILTHEHAKLIGCGRLDAGVHAESYVFNVMTKTDISTTRIIKSLNGILHATGDFDICIYHCEEVSSDFHARFSATGKHYRYHLWNGVGEHAKHRQTSWHINIKHSLDNLQGILKIFEGTHNFNSFRATDCGSQNPIKTIHSIRVTQDTKLPELYQIDIIGDGFLKNMIRNLVGASLRVIKDKTSVETIQGRLNSGKRDYNLCAPAHGLTLIQVFYLPIQNVENIS